MEKKCSKCEKIKPVECFYKDGRINRQEYMSLCKDCHGLNVSKWQRSKIGLISMLYSRQKHRCNRDNRDLPTYTKTDFVNWVANHSAFNDLYESWVKSDYDKNLIPSVDRIDENKSYCFENIRLVTWKENFEAATECAIFGKRAKQPEAHPIIQFDLHGNKIAEHRSIRQAGRDCNIHPQLIRRCLTSRKYSSHGFLWMKKSDYESGVNDFYLYQQQKVSVVKLDVDMNILAIHESISSAARIEGISSAFLGNILNGKRKNTTNFIWKYAD